MATTVHPINNRAFNLFLSHAHIDKQFADHLYRWCRQFAEIKVWYDSEHLQAGRLIAAEIGNAIGECQSAIVILSENSLKSGWVEQEYNTCIVERNAYKDFQLIPLRIDGSRPPKALESAMWIDIANRELTSGVATKLLAALHGNDTDPSTIDWPCVYLARGSLPHEAEFGRYISAQLRHYKLRTVRDAPQAKFLFDRIEQLMMGCIGVICVLSHRGDGKTSKYFFDEMRLARKLELPILAIVDDAVQQDLSEWADVTSRRVPQLAPIPELVVDEALAGFTDEIRHSSPRRPAYCFLGHAFKEDVTSSDEDRSGATGARSEPPEHAAVEQTDNASHWEHVRRCMEVVTGMPCVSGDGIQGKNIQDQIVERIRNATFCLFDISNNRLNSCIEAGMAIGAQAPFELLSRGPRRSPEPFMFRNKQIWYYDKPAELIGLVRRLTLDFRRVVS